MHNILTGTSRFVNSLGELKRATRSRREDREGARTGERQLYSKGLAENRQGTGVQRLTVHKAGGGVNPAGESLVIKEDSDRKTNPRLSCSPN